MSALTPPASTPPVPTPAAPLPPGPKGRPWLGSLPELSRDPLSFLQGVARDYGGVARFTVLGHPAYLVTDPAAIEEVLVTQSRKFIKSRDYRDELRFLGQGLLTSEGDFWLRQRRLAQPAFHRARINAYGEVMVSLTERMLAGWQDGETRDVSADMMRVTLDIVAKTLFDADLGDEAGEIGGALEVFMDYAMLDGNLFKMLLPKSFPLPANLRFRRAVEALDRVIYGLIAARRQEGKDRGDLLSMLMAASDEAGAMSDRQLRDELVTILLAGHETTANALSWTWYALSLHPEVEARLHAELNEVLGGRAPGVADLPRLTYAGQVVKESMRLYPPIWAVGREAVEDCVVVGYAVPKGTQVFLNQFVTHRDARLYDDPLGFRPERWQDGLEGRLPKYAYFPFGGGPRLCIGNAFATMEAVLLLATVAQRYRLKLLPEHPVSLQPSLTLRPKGGIKVVLEARSR